MAMSRKDYIALADALRNVRSNSIAFKRSEDARIVFGRVFSSIAGTLAENNPQFDYDKFYRAVYSEV